jgi:sulfite reductase alpha subunit-like flavoprotein
MRATVIRYKTKAGSTDENERLIKSVFQELEAKSPDGIRYAVLKLGDGSFVHFVVVEAPEASSPLRDLAAFRAFQTDIAARCIDAPQSAEASIVGNYRVFG